jgi:hypothetical protein
MAITRTAIIDDDGTGTTGTVLNAAWKTELYDQIDGIQAAGTWTPTDASGAALTFGSPSGTYKKIGPVVFVQFALTYPATANGAAASVGGLPFANGAAQGGLTMIYTSYGAGNTFLIQAGASSILLYTLAGAGITNANLSGVTIAATGMYFV